MRCIRCSANESTHGICNACLPAYERDVRAPLRKRAAGDDQGAECLLEAKDVDAAVELLEVLMALCKRCTGHDWCELFEFDAWEAVESGGVKVPVSFSHPIVPTKAERDQILALYARAGGWWTWTQDPACEFLFRRADEWVEMAED